MIIDFNTRQVIKDDESLTVTQTLTKVGNPILNSIENCSFDEAVQSNGIMSPSVLIKNFEAVLSIMKEGKSLSPEHIDLLIEQCKNWDVSDQFAIIE